MPSRPDLAEALDASARGDVLLEIARAGIGTGRSVEKLRRTAAIALEQFGGDLRPAMKRPLPEARKALMKFPSIGAPGAEKILLLRTATGRP